jgi:hypothetical protein
VAIPAAAEKQEQRERAPLRPEPDLGESERLEPQAMLLEEQREPIEVQAVLTSEVLAPLVPEQPVAPVQLLASA